jgi:voltage-gated sodium channel
VQSDLFNNTIFFCIMVAGILVGASTYPGMDESAVVHALDQVVLGFFCLEVVMKVMSEGVAPYQYFMGPEWTWNNFDFLIVVFSLPILPVGGSQVAFLRLIRLMRLAEVFREVRQLRMIMTGLIGGLKSIVYIVILLMLVFYLYAIAGIFFFRDNDPWHFRTIAVSLTSLFRLSTLSVSFPAYPSVHCGTFIHSIMPLCAVLPLSPELGGHVLHQLLRL